MTRRRVGELARWLGALVVVGVFAASDQSVECQLGPCPVPLLPIHSGWSKPVIRYSVAGLAAYPEAVDAAHQAAMLWTDYNTRNNSQITFVPALQGQSIDLTFLVAPEPLAVEIGHPDHVAAVFSGSVVSLTDGRLKSATIQIDVANRGTPPSRMCQKPPSPLPCKFFDASQPNYAASILSTLSHEMGHGMGLGNLAPGQPHASVSGSIMNGHFVPNDCLKYYPSDPCTSGSPPNLGPTHCDKAVIDMLYSGPPTAPAPGGGDPRENAPVPLPPPPGALDNDQDGYTYFDDCNDNSERIHPNQSLGEKCINYFFYGGGNLDVDCDGQIEWYSCVELFPDWFIPNLEPVPLEEIVGDCEYSVGPSSMGFTANGGHRSIGITTSGDSCLWSASSPEPWLTIDLVTRGVGSGSLSVSAAPNVSPAARSTTIVVAGKSIGVNQPGVGCSFTLSTANIQAPGTGSTGSVGLTASSQSCAWTAVANEPWIQVTSPATGSGDGSISFQIAENQAAGSRTGILSIGGVGVTVTQRGSSTPSARITAPLSDVVVNRGVPVQIDVDATDPDGIVSSVEFLANGAVINLDSSAPWTYTWSPTVSGRVPITARVTDNVGNQALSDVVVVAINSLDAVTIAPVAPRQGEAAEITVSGVDPCGAVMVDYGDGRVVTHPLSGLPFKHRTSWTQAGPKTVRVVGQANCVGEVVSSFSVAGNAAPAITLDTPTQGAWVPVGGTIALGATAVDGDSGIQRVEFYSGAALLHVDTTSPYQFSWSSMTAGTYVFTARAVDNGGASTTSPPKTVNVAQMVTGVSINPSQIAIGQSSTVTVTGTPLCTAVQINFGDGTAQSFPTSGLPFSHQHTWSTAGPKTITATGFGNCAGSASANLAVLQPNPAMWVDSPANNTVVNQTFWLAGWAVDAGATSGTGVSAIHVWAYPNPGSGAPPVWLGSSTYGGARPDVGAWIGNQFTNSGFGMAGTLAPGAYQLSVYAFSTVTNTFNQVQSVNVTVATSNPVVSVDLPAPNSLVGSQFWVAGWAADLGAPPGQTGVDQVEVFAFSNGDWNSPISLGAATYGGARPDVGAYYGTQFTNTGYGRLAGGLSPGTYMIVVWAHSTVSGGWPSGILWITVQ